MSQISESKKEEEKQTTPSKQSENSVRTCKYSSDGDTNGVIYTILKGANKSCDEYNVHVTSSSIAVGDVKDFISRDKTRCWTQNLPFSYFCVDFGENRFITPTHYSMGYGSSGSACLPRFWLFQGSKKLNRTDVQYSSTDTPQNDADWVTLSIHANDASINSEWGFHTWKINTKDSYRYFRVIQTGPNSFNANGSEDNWSQVFVVSRFELYGIIYSPPTSAPSISVSTLPLNYGLGGTPAKYTTPQVIRADPSITKEIQELMANLLRPGNESKAEKVKVHDIFV